MGTRGHGTYAKLYGDVWTHEKTLRIADAVEALGVPRRYAIREVVGQLHELLIWCLNNGDDGELGHLRPEMFARVVGWQDPATADRLLEAWRASGFLDAGGRTGWVLHDFDECSADVIAKRRARRAARLEAGRRADAGRTPHGVRTDADRTPSRARSAAATAAALSPPSPSPVDAPAAPATGPSAAAATRGDPGQPDAPQGERGGKAQRANAGAADARWGEQWLKQWNDCRAIRKLVPVRLTPKLRDAFEQIADATAAPGTPPAWSVMREYFRLDDDAVERSGWSPAMFPHRFDAAWRAAMAKVPPPAPAEPPAPAGPAATPEERKAALAKVASLSRRSVPAAPDANTTKANALRVAHGITTEMEREAKAKGG